MDEENHHPSPSGLRPSLQDQLVVLGQSVGFFLLVTALGLRAGHMVELVLALTAGVATLTINVLVACCRWEMLHRQSEGHDQGEQKERS